MTQPQKDLIRTVASLTAYAVIGVLVTGACWAVISIVIAGAHAIAG